MKKILFLTPYPHDTAPSQRFRFEQYFDVLEEEGIAFTQKSFLDYSSWDILYKKGFVLNKIAGVVMGFIRRIGHLISAPHYDFVFIHREVTPLGPPVFEFIISKVLRKKVIYDFDDAIWVEDPAEKGSLLGRIKWKSKVSSICKWSYKISCGNNYLGAYAGQFNKQVIINPTTIDTDKVDAIPKNRDVDGLITIGWTGSHSTLFYLDDLVPCLKKLETKIKFNFRVIANKEPGFKLNSLEFIRWNKETELQDLSKIDIGLMPLKDDLWSKGKCGFKALQYMAMGKPAIISPIGVNQEIIADKVNGFLCSTEDCWTSTMTTLIRNAELRASTGSAARQTILERYSKRSNRSTFIRLFE